MTRSQCLSRFLYEGQTVGVPDMKELRCSRCSASGCVAAATPRNCMTGVVPQKGQLVFWFCFLFLKLN